MINKITDQQLIEELKSRIDERTRAVFELEKLNNQLLEVNKKLTESEKLKSNFLSNARNEIINPMSAIMNLSQTIFTDKHLQIDKARHLASVIYNEAFELNFQLNNIFASAEIEAGAAFCEIYSLNPEKFIKSELDKFKEMAAAKNISMQFENKTAGETQIFNTDPAKLKLIFDNLVFNAINWSENNGLVKIILQHYNNKLQIHVEDNGPGIEAEFHKIIFDRFKTLNSSVHSQNKGHGLGLSIVKACIELLGGEITLESRKPGGSRFSVSIPETSDQSGNEGISENGQDFLFDNTEIF
jgi:signal transduction histidine kinase